MGSYPIAGLTDIRSDAVVVGAGQQLLVNRTDGANAGNAISGQVRLNIGPGSVTVNTTAVKTNSLIFISHADAAGASALYAANIVDGVSFDIKSDGGGGNNDLCNWLILNPP